MTRRFPHRVVGQWAQVVMAVVLLLCSGCTEEQTPVECICDGDSCPDDVCSLNLELPASCTFSTAEVTIDGVAVGSASPGELFSTCDTTIPAGSTVDVQISASGFEPGATVASCEIGGAPVTPEHCTLLFKLGETCRAYPPATVVVNSVEMGELTVDQPLVPCTLVVPGEEVQGTIRIGTSLVATTPLRCNVPGQQPQLEMECN